MKNDRLALLLLACTAAPAFAQGALPQCESANYDKVRDIFTVISPAPDAVNQQCLLTIHPAQASASSAQYPAPFLAEGSYAIELSGGGGGGGRGGLSTAGTGARGGDGFIKLALQTVAAAPAPAVIQPEPTAAAVSTEPRVSARPAKRDRN